MCGEARRKQRDRVLQLWSRYHFCSQPEIAATVADALSEDFVNADDAMTPKSDVNKTKFM